MRKVEILEPLAELQGAVRTPARVDDRWVGRIARVHHVFSAVMIPFLGIERPHDAHMVHLPGHFGHMLANADAGYRGFNRLERPAVFLAFRLEVPDVEMAGAA